MGGITGVAILLVLIFITPSLPIFACLRFALPKSTTLVKSDFVLILVGCAAGLFVNATMFTYLLSELGNQAANDGAFRDDPWIRNLFGSLVMINPSADPFRPTLSLLSWAFGAGIPRTNLIGFIFDLHARAAIVGLLLLILYRLVIFAEDWMMFLPYSRDSKHIRLAKALGVSISFEDSRYIVESTNKVPLGFGWFFSSISLFRNTVFHPWAILTHHYPRREFLMVDVLTTEGSLYSGVLTTWAPGDGELRAISMQYVLRYQAEDKAKGTPASVWTTPTNKPRSIHKKIFIKNNGEMTIPANRIETVHIWEIRRQSETEVVVKSAGDIEVVKWLFVLASIKPDFFSKIVIQFALSEAEYKKLKPALSSWLVEEKVEKHLPKEAIFFVGP